MPLYSLLLFERRAISSDGRAAALQAVGHRFNSCIAHHGVVVKLVITPACHAGGRGFKSRPLRLFIMKNLSLIYYPMYQSEKFRESYEENRRIQTFQSF